MDLDPYDKLRVKKEDSEVTESDVISESCESRSNSSYSSSVSAKEQPASYESVIKCEVDFGVIREHFTCGLCSGILVDACTIVECLHSFCRSCLVHHIYCSTQCPTCGCQLNHVLPFKDVKTDLRLQDLVRAVFPEVSVEETRRRLNFYWDKGVPPPLDKVYIDSHNALPPSQDYLDRPKYDCSRILLLSSRSNRVSFRVTLKNELSANKRLLEVIHTFHKSHQFLSCPSYARVGALHLAIEKKLQALGAKKLRLILEVLYNGEVVDKNMTVRHFYAVLHNYGAFPVDIEVNVQPVFKGASNKVSKHRSLETSLDNSTDEAVQNIFGNIETFFRENEKLSLTDDEISRKAKRRNLKRPIFRKRKRSSISETSKHLECDLSLEHIRQSFKEKELFVKATPVDLKAFLKETRNVPPEILSNSK